VLDDVSFAIESHEIAAILGPNGAGKTTLLRSINGILKPHSGSVLVDGRDLLHLTSREIARMSSYVAQWNEPGRMTAYDTVLLGRKPYIKWGPSRRDFSIVEKALCTLELENLSLRYTDRMSGGEFQKVCIARSVAQEPKVMLLDEPTSSLDLHNQIAILRLLRGIARDHEMCILMSMHDLNTALRYADKFLFLKGGCIYAAADRQHIEPEVIEEVYGVSISLQYIEGHPVVIPREEDKELI
jgi:iron complex transport system ATP-binding protein